MRSAARFPRHSGPRVNKRGLFLLFLLDLAPDVLAYERTGRAGDGVLVLLNFSGRLRNFEFAKASRVLLGSAREVGAAIPAGEIKLGPNEVVIAELAR